MWFPNHPLNASPAAAQPPRFHRNKTAPACACLLYACYQKRPLLTIPALLSRYSFNLHCIPQSSTPFVCVSFFFRGRPSYDCHIEDASNQASGRLSPGRPLHSNPRPSPTPFGLTLNSCFLVWSPLPCLATTRKMAPALLHHARALLEHALISRQPDNLHSLGPLAANKHLLARDTSNRPNPESGIVHPQNINNKFIFALFGILGAAFVCLGIWFFFWARNGGFYFKDSDWDDYKSTVLRRKGPNGTILSGATTETDLGGGSVYKDLDASTEGDLTTVVSGTTGITGITGGVSDIAGRERRRKKREQKEREKERRREEKRREKEEKKRSKHGRKVGEDGAVIDEDAEAEAAEYLRNYRHEKPARVGGINRESEASEWDGSTNPTESSRGGYTESTATSELMSSHERAPAKKSGGIRKVYSTADKRDSRETERIRAEARKLQEKGRAARSAASASSSSSSGGHRRNFSWQRDNRVDEDTAMLPPPSYTATEVDSRVPGSWAESDVGSEVGTKSYHHVIPGLSTVSSSSGGGSSVAGTDVRDYAEEKRKRRSAGYRRER